MSVVSRFFVSVSQLVAKITMGANNREMKADKPITKSAEIVSKKYNRKIKNRHHIFKKEIKNPNDGPFMCILGNKMVTASIYKQPHSHLSLYQWNHALRQLVQPSAPLCC